MQLAKWTPLNARAQVIWLQILGSFILHGLGMILTSEDSEIQISIDNSGEIWHSSGVNLQLRLTLWLPLTKQPGRGPCQQATETYCVQDAVVIYKGGGKKLTELLRKLL